MSPASAWRLRSCRRKPTRSISLAVWRPSACAGAAASGTFFSQRLGQLRPADAHTLARLDLGAQAGNRPVGRSATGSSSKGVTTRNAVHSSPAGGPGRDARFQRVETAACGEIAAPQPNRIFGTPNASAIRGLVQPASVSSTARARSASPDHATQQEPPSRCAVRRSPQPETFPRRHTPRESALAPNPKPIRWLTKRNLLSVEIALDLHSHVLAGMQEGAAAKVDAAIRAAIEGN